MDSSQQKTFLCGIVEGFYGRPWTVGQRKELFKRMKSLQLNTYMYAPKDDTKHRTYWRELYSETEGECLAKLIKMAKENDIDFYYALSPGLNITFSKQRDIDAIQKKMDQVAGFGCTAFALLFDDIDAELCDADKAKFKSFAQAQAMITNEIYSHMGKPKFMFCPTEYCVCRAVPNVKGSEYLRTLSRILDPAIAVMWTGPRVVSKRVTRSGLDELKGVFNQGHPLILWDNIHANDYDPKRIFLGPFTGREPDIINTCVVTPPDEEEKTNKSFFEGRGGPLDGVLSNPNCEFEANFVALHTLAQWSQAKKSPDTMNVVRSEQLTLHTDYDARNALIMALKAWLPYVNSRAPYLVQIPRCVNASQYSNKVNIFNANNANTAYVNDIISTDINAIVNAESGNGEKNKPAESEKLATDSPAKSKIANNESKEKSPSKNGPKITSAKPTEVTKIKSNTSTQTNVPYYKSSYSSYNAANISSYYHDPQHISVSQSIQTTSGNDDNCDMLSTSFSEDEYESELPNHQNQEGINQLENNSDNIYYGPGGYDGHVLVSNDESSDEEGNFHFSQKYIKGCTNASSSFYTSAASALNLSFIERYRLCEKSYYILPSLHMHPVNSLVEKLKDENVNIIIPKMKSKTTKSTTTLFTNAYNNVIANNSHMPSQTDSNIDKVLTLMDHNNDTQSNTMVQNENNNNTTNQENTEIHFPASSSEFEHQHNFVMTNKDNTVSNTFITPNSPIKIFEPSLQGSVSCTENDGDNTIVAPLPHIDEIVKGATTKKEQIEKMDYAIDSTTSKPNTLFDDVNMRNLTNQIIDQNFSTLNNEYLDNDRSNVLSPANLTPLASLIDQTMFPGANNSHVTTNLQFNVQDENNLTKSSTNVNNSTFLMENNNRQLVTILANETPTEGLECDMEFEREIKGTLDYYKAQTISDAVDQINQKDSQINANNNINDETKNTGHNDNETHTLTISADNGTNQSQIKQTNNSATFKIHYETFEPMHLDSHPSSQHSVQHKNESTVPFIDDEGRMDVSEEVFEKELKAGPKSLVAYSDDESNNHNATDFIKNNSVVINENINNNTLNENITNVVHSSTIGEKVHDQTVGNDFKKLHNINNNGSVILQQRKTLRHAPAIRFTLKDALLLSDLFYLPFEHGPQGQKLLDSFHWLKANAYKCLLNPTKDANIISENYENDESKSMNNNDTNSGSVKEKTNKKSNNNVTKTSSSGPRIKKWTSYFRSKKASAASENNTGSNHDTSQTKTNTKQQYIDNESKPDPKLNYTAEYKEWHEKAQKFFAFCDQIIAMCTKMMMVKNKAALFEYFPYVYDLKGVVTLARGFISWLEIGRFPSEPLTSAVINGSPFFSNTSTMLINMYDDKDYSDEDDYYIVPSPSITTSESLKDNNSTVSKDNITNELTNKNEDSSLTTSQHTIANEESNKSHTKKDKTQVNEKQKTAFKNQLCELLEERYSWNAYYGKGFSIVAKSTLTTINNFSTSNSNNTQDNIIAKTLPETQSITTDESTITSTDSNSSSTSSNNTETINTKRSEIIKETNVKDKIVEGKNAEDISNTTALGTENVNEQQTLNNNTKIFNGEYDDTIVGDHEMTIAEDTKGREKGNGDAKPNLVKENASNTNKSSQGNGESNEVMHMDSEEFDSHNGGYVEPPPTPMFPSSPAKSSINVVSNAAIENVVSSKDLTTQSMLTKALPFLSFTSNKETPNHTTTNKNKTKKPIKDSKKDSNTEETKAQKEIKSSSEPTLLRGGLQAEFHRMLPLDTCIDLFCHRPPYPPVKNTYRIRLFNPSSDEDEMAIYNIARMTFDDGRNGNQWFKNYPELPGDYLVGGFLALCPATCFVIEEINPFSSTHQINTNQNATETSSSIVGYMLCAPDSKKYLSAFEMSVLPEMVNKYKITKQESNLADRFERDFDEKTINPNNDYDENDKIAQSIIESKFMKYKRYLPYKLLQHYPSIIQCAFSPALMDFSMPKRMLACLMSVLKLYGSTGVFTTVPLRNINEQDLYCKLLGFYELTMLQDYPPDALILGRAFY